MGENANRYFIMALFDKRTETFDTKDSFDMFLSEYSKMNSSPKNDVVGGSLETLYIARTKSWIVKYSLYKKLTPQQPLDGIDKKITERYDNENEIKTDFKDELVGVKDPMKSKLFIGYMYSGQVRTIPIFYKKDRIYTDYRELLDLMISYAESEYFITGVCSNRKLNAPEYRNKISNYLEKIQLAHERYTLGTVGLIEVEAAIRNMMRTWCFNNGKLNQRSVRDMGSIVKNNLERTFGAPEVNKKNMTRKRIPNNNGDITLF